jgi:peptide/nickel transport system substrate-binding protein
MHDLATRRHSRKGSAFCVTLLAACLLLTSCHRANQREDNTLRFAIESSPNNLDLRQGTDAQSERVGALIYDPLVHRDRNYNLEPWLALSWSQPDPLTWVFHLRPNVRFHDGHILNSADPAWTIRSMTDGTIVTAKASAFADIASIDTPDPLTLVLHTNTPDASIPFNLSDGLFGVVEHGAGRDEGLHPNGTGPFRFISQVQDKEVVLTRNDAYWQTPPSIRDVRFEVVPDNITTALELKKGSTDVESNAITLDEVHALENTPHVQVESVTGSAILYLQFNVADPSLRDARVRQAIACALDKPSLIAAIWLNQARPADSLLPPGHWALAPTGALPQYPHDVARAQSLLDAAGFHPDAHGIRLRLTLKTSTDETTRLLAQAVQQQLSQAGIAIDIRPAEFGTFYADITRGAFQMYILRWTGASNLDPDIFRNVYSSAAMPPKGANRGHYANPDLDRILTAAAATSDLQQRRALYVQAQQVLARDLASIPLWYPNTEIVHSDRLTGITPDPSGDFSFLRTAVLQ